MIGKLLAAALATTALAAPATAAPARSARHRAHTLVGSVSGTNEYVAVVSNRKFLRV